MRLTNLTLNFQLLTKQTCSLIQLTYSRVPNNRICTIIFFRSNFPSVRSLIGTARLFFPEQISPLYVYFSLYDFYFEHFFRTFSIKVKKNPWCTQSINQWFEWMFLIFEFTKAFELSLTACRVVLKINAYLYTF